MSNFILVHGAWQGAWSWERVVDHMEAARETHDLGELLAPDLPGHGRRFADEIRRITMDHYINAVVTLVQVRRLDDVVLVGHGFSATFLPQVALELGDKVAQVIFIAGELPPEGRMAYHRLSHWNRLMLRVFKAGEKGFRLPDFIFKDVLGKGLDADSGREMLSKLVPEPILPWRTPVSRQGYVGRFPTAYVVLTKDKVIPPRLQRRYIDSIKPEQDHRPVQVEQLDAGHAALLSHPKEIARLLVKYAAPLSADRVN